MTLSLGLAGGFGLQGGTGVRWEDSILRAPGLGQCCLYCIQLFTARLQLDPKQCCICAIAGFLRQRGRDCEPTPSNTYKHIHVATSSCSEARRYIH